MCWCVTGDRRSTEQGGEGLWWFFFLSFWEFMFRCFLSVCWLDKFACLPVTLTSHHLLSAFHMPGVLHIISTLFSKCHEHSSPSVLSLFCSYPGNILLVIHLLHKALLILFSELWHPESGGEGKGLSCIFNTCHSPSWVLYMYDL